MVWAETGSQISSDRDSAKSDELVLLFPKLYTTWKGAVFIITDVITKVWGTTKHHKNCPSYVLG